MAKTIYYLDATNERVESTLDEIRAKVRKGELSAESRVLHEGMEDWRTLGEAFPALADKAESRPIENKVIRVLMRVLALCVIFGIPYSIFREDLAAIFIEIQESKWVPVASSLSGQDLRVNDAAVSASSDDIARAKRLLQSEGCSGDWRLNRDTGTVVVSYSCSGKGDADTGTLEIKDGVTTRIK